MTELGKGNELPSWHVVWGVGMTRQNTTIYAKNKSKHFKNTTTLRAVLKSDDFYCLLDPSGVVFERKTIAQMSRNATMMHVSILL